MLVSALIAGGWISLLVIIIALLIGMFFSSFFGVFFSSENNNNSITINSTIIELNKELSDKIQDIKDRNQSDKYEIDYNLADWKEILALYTVKLSGTTDLISLNEEKKRELKDIFWKFHNITIENSIIINENNEQVSTLDINVNSKSFDEMLLYYQFNSEQVEQVNELLNEKYDMLWTKVIYGNSDRNKMVNVALLEVGNIGGEPYWRWYGFNSRAEWCAIFVSWVANELGYIDLGIIPKFSFCREGIEWFKSRDLWKNKEYIQNPGDIIFF